MKSHFFAYIARMRYITRWALMRNTFSENVQEHSHMVAVLAHALAVIRNRVYGGQIDAGQVAAAALYHDASEIITGDMPTPIKYYAPEIRDAYKKVEAVACGRLLAMLPDELRPDYDDVLDCADGEVLELVKAADKLSEAETRLSEAEKARETLEKTLESAQKETATLSRRAQANELLVSAQAALEQGDYAALRSHLEALGAYADALKDDGAALYETLRSYID